MLHAIERKPTEVRNLRSGTPGLTSEQVDEALAQLIAEGDALLLGARERAPGPADFVFATNQWQRTLEQLTETVGAFHSSTPLRPGMAREEARRRLNAAPSRLFDDIVASAVAAGAVVDDGATLRLPEFRISLSPARRAQADVFLAAVHAQPYAPPGPHEQGLDQETLAALEQLGDITKIAEGVYFAPSAWNELITGTLAYIDENGAMTLSQFRDHFGTSRKYAQAALEHLDRLKYTRRVGDDRVRGPRRPDAP